MSWNLAALGFGYPGAPSALQYDSYKYLADVRYRLDPVSIGAYYDFYGNFFGSGPAHYLEALAVVDLPRDFVLDLRYGRQRFNDSSLIGMPDYTFRSVSLQRAFGDWNVRLTWQDNGLSDAECFAGQNWCGQALNLGVTYTYTFGSAE